MLEGLSSGGPPIKEFSSIITQKINDWTSSHGTELELIVESGRFLVAGAGLRVTSVVNLKRARGEQLAILDAGYNLPFDSLILRQSYPITVLRRDESPLREEVKLAGNLYDSFDVLLPPRGEGKGWSCLLWR